MRIFVGAAVTVLTLTLVPLGRVSVARADDEEAEQARPKPYWHVSLAGGMLLPRGDMTDRVDLGLDLVARFGWSSRSGLGLMVEGEYAPLRVDLTDTDAHMFLVAGGPRFTIGHGMARPWVYVGGGAVIERVITDVPAGGTDVSTEKDWVIRGSAGLDLHFFANGGLTLGGSYTRAFESSAGYDFFSVDAGLVFTL